MMFGIRPGLRRRVQAPSVARGVNARGDGVAGAVGGYQRKLTPFFHEVASFGVHRG